MEDIKQMTDRHKKEIEYLQAVCEHGVHHRSRFMWAPGHFSNDVEVCDNCGKFLEHYTNMTPIDKDINEHE